MGMKIIHEESQRRRTPDRRTKKVKVDTDRRTIDRRSGTDRRSTERLALPLCEIEVPAEVEAQSPAEIESWVQAARAQWRGERLKQLTPSGGTRRRHSAKE